MSQLPPNDEPHFAEIDVAMMYVEEARRRTEQSAAALRAAGAEAYLIDALDSAEQALSQVNRKLRQKTFFAAPSAQTVL